MVEPAMIEVSGLTKFYGPHPAIKDLNFTVGRGEIVGFLGPNGAGKTTTMRILTGYMPPSTGEVRIAGYDVLKQSLQARAHIGYLPENVPLYPEMTVWGYLNYMAKLRKVPNRPERVDEVMVMTHISERADSYIGTLSKGWRQRVGLAQALLHLPDVLILDEPTIGLDPRQVRDVRAAIREVGQDRTVLLSTHILSEVSMLCNRVLIISGGQIREDMRLDTPDGALIPRRLAVRLVSDADYALPALRNIEGVEDVVPTPDGSLEITQNPGKDVRAQVAATVTRNGWGLLEMRPLGLSLEDRFLEVTQADMADEDQEEEDHGDFEAAETELEEEDEQVRV